MKTGIGLSVRCASRDVRDRLQAVLAPDNVGGPRGMRFSVSPRDRSLNFRITSEAPAASLSTAVSLLNDIALFQEVWLLSRDKDA